MGFLDNVKKGLNDAASSINQAVNNAQSGSGQQSPPPPPGSAPAAPPPGDNLIYGDDAFIDGFHPETWFDLDGASIEELLTMELPHDMNFGPPSTFETEEAYVARWSDAAGGYTFDVASIKEERLGELQTQENVCAAYGGQLATSEPATIGDVAVQGSNGPGHRQLVVCIGDLVAKMDLYGPAELDLRAAAIGVYEAMACALRLNE